MMPAYIQTLIEHLQNHPMIGLSFAFIISLVESIAILGTIIPGSVTMTAVGVMIGSGILPVTTTLLIAILGALLGDILSYWFGWHYRDHIYQLWPFRKYQKLMQLGEKFFKKHGKKSVVIGRFFGPVRSLVPLIAGVLEMRPFAFFIAAIISATTWALVYISPGIFLGALSLELPAGKVTQFLGYILLLILAVWVVIWIAHAIFQKVWKYVDSHIAKIWHFLKDHRGLNYLSKIIANPRNLEDHRQLTLLFLAIFTFIIFCLIAYSVSVQGFITRLDQPLFYLLQSFRTHYLDKLMLGITFLGDKYPLLIAALLLFLVFIYRRAFWIACHWLGLVFVSAIAIKGMKLVMPVARPDTLQAIKSFTSFPSGHTALSASLFAFSAVLIASEMTNKRRRMPYKIMALFVSLIILSRLYLGVHWLSDILGAIALAASIVLFFTVSYRRELNHILSAKFLVCLIPNVIFIISVCYGVLRIKSAKNTYIRPTPVQIISFDDWWENKVIVPLYRKNRFGRPIQPLNIEWVGDLDKIRDLLMQQGWKDDTHRNTLKNIVLQDITQPETEKRLSLFPKLYKNMPPVLVMSKLVRGRWVSLQLWDAYIRFREDKQHLWLGVVYLPAPHAWLTLRHEDVYFKSSQNLNFLENVSDKVQFKLYQVKTNQLPERLQLILPFQQLDIIKLVEK